MPRGRRRFVPVTFGRYARPTGLWVAARIAAAWEVARMRIVVRLFAVIVAAAMVAVVSGGSASAHEVRLVGDGQYEIVVGFLEEPAFVGEKNGLDLTVSKVAPASATPVAAASPVADGDDEGAASTPVEGLETTLQAEVIYGDQRLSLPLSTVWMSPGKYASYFFPMAEGDYSFHITGTIEGVAIDETLTSSPEGFGAVEPRIEFPASTASVSSATSADTAGRSVVPGLLGLAGLAVGGVVYTTRRRSLL